MPPVDSKPLTFPQSPPCLRPPLWGLLSVKCCTPSLYNSFTITIIGTSVTPTPEVPISLNCQGEGGHTRGRLAQPGSLVPHVLGLLVLLGLLASLGRPKLLGFLEVLGLLGGPAGTGHHGRKGLPSTARTRGWHGGTRSRRLHALGNGTRGALPYYAPLASGGRAGSSAQDCHKIPNKGKMSSKWGTGRIAGKSFRTGVE